MQLAGQVLRDAKGAGIIRYPPGAGKGFWSRITADYCIHPTGPGLCSGYPAALFLNISVHLSNILLPNQEQRQV